MPNDGPVVREVAWRELFPWLLLVRSLRVSMHPWQLLAAVSGLLLTIVGWWALAKVFGGTGEQPLKAWLSGPYQSCPWHGQEWSNSWGEPASAIDPIQEVPGRASPPELGRYPSNPFLGPWWQLAAPLRQLFNHDLSITGLAFLLCAGLWAAAVWALVGGAITRRAALQFAREENLGLGGALRYAREKWPSYFAAPLLPLIGLFICSWPILAMGLLMRFGLGLLIVGVLWPLALLASFVMALLLVALLFGWPLMWPTISTERTDSFDALSRSWSYVFHRPLHYLFYAAVVTVLGGLGWLFVANLAEWVIYLSAWTASWTAGNTQVATIFGEGESLGLLGRGGANLIHFWTGCVRLAALGFVYSYFWTASTAIYFLLRRDDDGTDLDDISLDAAEQTFGLPPLERDEHGVPVVPKTEEELTAPSEPATEVAAPEAAPEQGAH